MKRRLIASLLAVIATACVYYTGQPDRDTRVVEARGLTGRLYFDNTRFLTAELLWGDSTGYLVLQPGSTGRVLWAPVERVVEIWFPVSELVQSRPRTPAQFEALRAASRFPFGPNPQAIEQILAERGQRHPDTLQTSGATTSFLDAGRAGTSKYRSSDAAVADGFKPVGTEFPFMGEHWVNLPRVLENSFDPAQPSVLIYVHGRRGRELAGVGYTALLAVGEKPPVSPAPENAWHEHNGSVVEESLPGLHDKSGHDGGHTSGHNGGHDGVNGGVKDGLRLAVMHAWIWTENPEGVFVTDNRALPFAREGTPPRALSIEALRGLTLAQDSAGYYRQTLRTSLQMTDAEDLQLTRILSDLRPSPASGDEQLAVSWQQLWITLLRDMPHRSGELARVRATLER
jgi:hypothetical protein